MSQNKNPYAQASGAYDTNAKANAGNQREMEARILYKSNRQLQLLIDHWDTREKDALDVALKYNRDIWMLFYDTALENKDGNRPNDLRSNIVNLANFIFKRELDVLSDPKPEKLQILININNEIAAGLMTQPQGEASPQQQNVIEQTSSTDIQG